MKSWFKNNVFALILIVITLFIAYQTYQKGTFLSGWDTLHPEFDFELSFTRLISGVWRQEQGLGAVAAHSHMADLPRVVFLWLIHFFMPLSMLRYIYVFMCLVLGPVGMYLLIRYLLEHSNIKHNSNIIAFISGTYYLLNYSTIQQFYVPFEMFPTQYAFLPWIIFISFQFFSGRRYKLTLFLFVLFTLFATPQAYAAHLWYPFFGVYCLFLFLLTLKNRCSFQSVRKSVILIFLTIAINSFWLFPNIYYVVTQSKTPEMSKQNRLSSQEYQLKNRENGYLSDVALIKGFYFNWDAYDYKLQKSTPLMPEWVNYIQQSHIKFIGYCLFLTSILGLIFSFLKKKIMFAIFSPFFIFPFILLMNHTPPFEQIFNLINSFPLFEEALRFVFTKMSILLIFSYCIFFALSISFITRFLEHSKIKLLRYSFFVILLVSLVVYVKPIFQGHLISSKMKISIPNEYFDLWSYMKEQKEGIILPLPLYSYSGWQYYNFGYQGAGFIWFGLKQPILDRDFDRWNINNEQAYNEFHHAVYSQNIDQFEKTLNKYNIQYILWDHNIISPEEKNRNQVLFSYETDSLIRKLIQKNKLILKKNFSSRLFLYQTNSNTKELENKEITINILPKYNKNYFDTAYLEKGNYISSQQINTKGLHTFYFPFRNMLNNNDSINFDVFRTDINNRLFYINPNLDTYYQNIYVPMLSSTEKILSTSVEIVPIEYTSQKYQITIVPNIPDFRSVVNPITFVTKLDNNRMQINDSSPFIRNPISLSFDSWLSNVFFKTKEPNSINDKKIMFESNPQILPIKDMGDELPISSLPMLVNVLDPQYDASLSIQKADFNQEVVMNSLNTNKTLDFPLAALPHNLGYILGIESKYYEGLPLRFCMYNTYSGLCDVFTDISKNSEYKNEYFLIPPGDENWGYSLKITSLSLGNYPSTSYLKNIKIFPFQYNYLSGIYLFDKEAGQNDVGNNYIIKNQAFHDGWKAYMIRCQSQNVICQITKIFPFLTRNELKEHVLVNNWANGWLLPPASEGSLRTQGQEIIIIFWPQYLQFIGFGLLITTFVGIVFWKTKKNT